jgi:pyruvate dehydrogenase (quinone)
MAKTAADLLIERLIAWGVDTIFGLPGDGINGLMESLRTHREEVRFVLVRHEESAALAACGYAKFTGRLGVCLATSGPGGIHFLNGLYDAAMDGQPVIAITGHTFHDLIGTRQQQDVDLARLCADVAVYSERISSPAHVENAVDEAVRLALARRGVACLTIPSDTQSVGASDKERSKRNVPGHSDTWFHAMTPVPSGASLEAAARIIDEGSKVVILAGRGCLGAREALLALADRAAAPIVKALLGKAAVPDDSPYTTGGVGLLGTAPSQDALKECDVLVIAGSSFPYVEFYPEPGQGRTVQIDVDPSRIGLRHPVDVGLVGDCRAVLDLLVPLVARKEDRGFLEKAQAGMDDWRELMRERGTRLDSPLKPQTVAYHLDALLDDDAIVAIDSGTITTWAARYLNARGDMMFTTSGMLATMACALPYAIGAGVAYPGRQLIVIVGDGGFSMLMAELATAAHYDLPVKVIVFKNNSLGQIKWEQIAFEGNPEYGVELYPIDFAAYARACGVAGFTLEDPRAVESTLREALAAPGPALVEAVIDPSEPPLPGNIPVEYARNFVEAMLEGQPDRLEIVKNVIRDKIRHVL